MLEVGSAKVQGIPNLCEIARDLGIKETTGVDISQGAGVDFVFDFGLPPALFEKEWRSGQFATVCIFNVLEHTFDPLTVLTNALSCVEENGTLLVLTPSIWPIHSYPHDFNRLLPDWYLEFSRRNKLKLVDKQFCWLSQFGIEPIERSSEPTLPGFLTRGQGDSKARYWISKISHKFLNTYGRSHWATHSAIGAAFIRGN
jgi:SAM-dependent methyltransferase